MPLSESGNRLMRQLRVPQRSCVICRQVKNKRDLIRLVRNGDEISIDTKGKMPGRGAYLCNSVVCWKAALTKNRLDQVLRTKLSDESRERLVEYSKNMSKQGSIE